MKPLIALTCLLLIALAAPALATDPCLKPEAHIARMWTKSTREEAKIALTTCDGKPNSEALQELSYLARPAEQKDAEKGQTPSLDEGLLVRLQAIVDQWPENRIDIISGIRPGAREGSRHRVGRALDFRVDGVDREDVAKHALSLEKSGVGFYPNSHFTHLDVRDDSYSWVDHSHPGEAAKYGVWPPADNTDETLADNDANAEELKTEEPIQQDQEESASTEESSKEEALENAEEVASNTSEETAATSEESVTTPEEVTATSEEVTATSEETTATSEETTATSEETTNSAQAVSTEEFDSAQSEEQVALTDPSPVKEEETKEAVEATGPSSENPQDAVVKADEPVATTASTPSPVAPSGNPAMAEEKASVPSDFPEENPELPPIDWSAPWDEEIS